MIYWELKLLMYGNINKIDEFAKVVTNCDHLQNLKYRPTFFLYVASVTITLYE